MAALLLAGTFPESDYTLPSSGRRRRALEPVPRPGANSAIPDYLTLKQRPPRENMPRKSSESGDKLRDPRLTRRRRNGQDLVVFPSRLERADGHRLCGQEI